MVALQGVYKNNDIWYRMWDNNDKVYETVQVHYNTCGSRDIVTCRFPVVLSFEVLVSHYSEKSIRTIGA